MYSKYYVSNTPFCDHFQEFVFRMGIRLGLKIDFIQECLSENFTEGQVCEAVWYASDSDGKKAAKNGDV